MQINLTEKYRPKKYSEFIGDPIILEEMEECIEAGQPILLIGKQGCGKTTAAFLVAYKLGYQVVETNASDKRKKEELEDLKKKLTNKTLFPTLYLLDEVDGVSNQKGLYNTIKDSTKPIVMTANFKMKVSMQIKKHAKVIEFRNPSLYEIVKRIKYIAAKEGLNVTYEKVTHDIRASINNVFYGGDGYKEDPNDFEKVELIFKKGKIYDIDPIWLIDNVKYFYYGYDIYKAIRIIQEYALHKDPMILSCLPRATRGKTGYPYYLRKMRRK